MLSISPDQFAALQMAAEQRHLGLWDKWLVQTLQGWASVSDGSRPSQPVQVVLE